MASTGTGPVGTPGTELHGCTPGLQLGPSPHLEQPLKYLLCAPYRNILPPTS